MARTEFASTFALAPMSLLRMNQRSKKNRLKHHAIFDHRSSPAGAQLTYSTGSSGCQRGNPQLHTDCSLHSELDLNCLLYSNGQTPLRFVTQNHTPLLDAIRPLDQIRALKHNQQSAYGLAGWTINTLMLYGCIDRSFRERNFGGRCLIEDIQRSPEEECL
jgi:hypothetical protein